MSDLSPVTRSRSLLDVTTPEESVDMLRREGSEDPRRTVWAYLREAALEGDRRQWAFWFEVMKIVADPSCRKTDTEDGLR